MEILKPYRARIDALDDQIVDLLVKRTGIIHEVAAVKAEAGIAPILQDRVDEVINRAAARAEQQNLDPALVREIYKRLVDFSCDLEAGIIAKKQ